MTNINQKDLQTYIKSKKDFYAYVFYGDDTFMQEYFVNKLTLALLGERVSDFNCINIDAEKFIVDVLLFNANMYALGGKKIIIVKNLDFNKLNKVDFTAILDLLSTTNASCHIIFYNSVELPKLKIKPLLAIKNIDVAICEFPIKSEQELCSIIVSFCSRRQCKISSNTARTIAIYCGFNMNIIISELTKLCFYAENGIIDDEMVEALVIKNVDVSIYQITKDIDAKHISKALQTLNTLLKNRVEPVYILTVISSTYSDLYIAKSASMHGKHENDILNDFKYAKNTAFKVSAAIRRSHNIKSTEISRKLKVLIEADLALKSTSRKAYDILADVVLELSR